MLKIGEIFFRFRDYTPIPFVIIMIIYPAANVKSLIVGTSFMVIGELTRILGVSHIGGISRTKTYSTGKKLITAGLFSHVRNPLYIGNFFLSVGLVIAANVHIYFTAVFIAFFFIQYTPIILWEENNLRNKFGASFDEYCAQVPRWIPSLTKKLDSDLDFEQDFQAAIKSEKNTLAAAITLYVIVLWRSGIFIAIKDFFLGA